jgi:hypothetical protein
MNWSFGGKTGEPGGAAAAEPAQSTRVPAAEVNGDLRRRAAL